MEGEVADSGCVYSLVDSIRPDEIYNLAAQSHVGTSFEQPDYTFQVNALGPLYFLEAIKHFSLSSRFYQASTSEMFGKNFTVCKDVKHQCEETPFMPQSRMLLLRQTHTTLSVSIERLMEFLDVVAFFSTMRVSEEARTS